MNYPLMDSFLTMLWFFVGVLWLFLTAWIILNIFRSHDLGGLAKACWLVLVIFLPFLGVFTYVVVRGAHLIGQQAHDSGTPQDEAARAYERFEAGGRGGHR